MSTLIDSMKMKEFEAGDELMVQGDIDNSLIFILRGGAKVFIRSANTEETMRTSTCPCVLDILDAAGSLPVATLREGDFFGEEALLQADFTRRASVVAASPMTCMTLHRQHIVEHESLAVAVGTGACMSSFPLPPS